MGRGGESAEVFAGEAGAGHGEEGLVEGGLGAREIAEAEELRGQGGHRRRLAGRSLGVARSLGVGPSGAEESDKESGEE